MYTYESLAWIKDKNGKEYVCPFSAVKGDLNDRNGLNEEENKYCSDVREIIANEPWLITK